MDGSGSRRGRPRLRPDAEVLWAAEDRLHLSFANHTVTFTSLVVTRIVDALLTELEVEPDDAEDLVPRTALRAEAEPEMVAYVLEVLDESHCLYWVDEPSAFGPEAWPTGADGLWAYFAAIGEDPGSVASTLADARPLVLAPEPGAAAMRGTLQSASIAADLLTVHAGTSISEIEELVGDRVSQGAAPVAAWGFPYQSPAALAINAIALEGVPVLFGSCEGLVGRVGPFVVARSSPCLECLNARLLTHSGTDERSSVSVYRRRYAHTVPRARPTHPVFLTAVLAFFVLELQQILLKRPPRTLAGMIDFGLADGSTERRSILRAPRCPACENAMPPRFGWNANFPSPTVKSEGLGA